jgi:Zn-dependent protease with chaperone function
VSELLPIRCGVCGRQFQVPTDWAGKSARCKCGEKIRIAVQETVVSNSTAAELSRSANVTSRPSREMILAQLPQKIQQVRTPVAYLLALAIVAAVMLVLPLVYLGLIAVTAYAVYWHFAYSEWLGILLNMARGKAKFFVVLLYLAPGIVGGILVLFMLKPFFRRNRESVRPNVVSREQESVLFEFVDQLCDLIKAPRPVRIEIDQRVNASASFASPMSLLSNRLVLTIGLPLAEGLSLVQFTSVLAHEFGHFSQFWAMRFYYIIETINIWFRRVSLERDILDQKLSDVASQLPAQVTWILILADIMVWSVRTILTGFRYVGIFVSRRLSRQMEFDADQFAVRVAGGPATAAAFERIGLLSIGETKADRSSSQFLREGHALDNYPRYVVHQAEELPRDQVAAFIQILHDRPATWSSTHPGTSERLQRIQCSSDSERKPSDIAASFLFADLTQLSRETTRKSYNRRSGAEVDMSELTSVDDLIAEDKDRRRKFEIARGLVFNADVFLERWAPLNEAWTTELSDEAIRTELRKIHYQLERGAPSYAVQCLEWRTLRNVSRNILIARIVIVVRGWATKEEFPGLPGKLKNDSVLDDLVRENNQRIEKAEGEMAEYERLCALRFLRSLQLAVRHGADDSRLRELHTASICMGIVSLSIPELETRLAHFEWLFAWLAKKPGHPTAAACLEKLTPGLIDMFQFVYGELSVIPFPFPLPYATSSMSNALLPHFTDASNPALLYRDISRFCSGYRTLRNRVTGELAVAVKKSEMDNKFSGE